MSEHSGARTGAKLHRRDALLDAAAAMFAERGFNGVSMEELGAAVGVSGPAVYRHFSSKQAVLAEILIDVSTALLEGGTRRTRREQDDEAALHALIAFHVDFALDNPDVIRVQDRDLHSLAPDEAHTVRSLQRRYVELWVGVLERLTPEVPTPRLRVRAHAAFGLMNSTPHTLDSRNTLDPGQLRAVLERMAFAALTS
ncbi:DNA-binding transcriptional regulator, AcrR family [Paramicrobacterium humi]|uniref:DNA-binding transcriptional regulator, AcrR family n=1 Tax=Paramicrobacterium humi TaxID=640635 RepID=A0A1H4PQE3_9MICO|nr:TetR/AcrR family transcriptional regulator [Microbacterium humi]SEC09521.1 DNA-binding transcriptional regulator, AcrR family [Microbacterium humi]